MSNNIKIYEMPGCISCRLKFTLGKAQPFEAYFDGGIPDKNYPAVYAARSVGQQLAIENSGMFKAGKIRVRIQKKKAEIKAKAIDATINVKSYPEVATHVDAIAILKGEYGVSATRLKTPASVLRVAEEKGVSFPNLK